MRHTPQGRPEPASPRDGRTLDTEIPRATAADSGTRDMRPRGRSGHRIRPGFWGNPPPVPDAICGGHLSQLDNQLPTNLSTRPSRSANCDVACDITHIDNDAALRRPLNLLEQESSWSSARARPPAKATRRRPSKRIWIDSSAVRARGTGPQAVGRGGANRSRRPRDSPDSRRPRPDAWPSARTRPRGGGSKIPPQREGL